MPTDETQSFGELVGVLESLIGALRGPGSERGQLVVKSEDGGTPGARTEARYRALVEQIPALTFTVSLEEGTPELYVGPQIEELLGFTQKEWMEDPILWFRQCHPEDRDIWHQEFARGIATGGPFHAECRVFAKDGHVVWLRGEARLVRSDRGEPLFIQGIAFDITESKLAEKKMKEAQEIRVLNERLNAVGQMAASIGHDLRNPLGAIRNAWAYIEPRVTTAAGPAAPDPRIAQLGGIITRELARCHTIIGELLEFARDRAPNRVRCSIAQLVDEAFSVVTKPAATMELSSALPPDLPDPQLDFDQMRQVLVNLVQNGLESVAPNGCVNVSAHIDDHDGRLVLEVIDNGRGIAPDLHEQIWKPLFTTKPRGTGLGLPIVANIVQRHGGHVFVESAPGRGATFRLFLPMS